MWAEAEQLKHGLGEKRRGGFGQKEGATVREGKGFFNSDNTIRR